MALLEERERYGLELVRTLASLDRLVTSEGTVYPLLSRLRDAGWVSTTWRQEGDDRPRKYYTLTRPAVPPSGSSGRTGVGSRAW